MCIHCNLPQEGQAAGLADAFLSSFAASRLEMTKAAEAMDAVLRTELAPDVRQRYDATHKRMRRLIREWNSIEEFRERNTGQEIGR